MKVLVAVLGLLFVSAALAAKKKADEWDELEDLLLNIDEKEDTPDAYEKDRGSSEEIEEEEGTPRRNPCEGHHCGWGKECRINKKNKPHCVCVDDCPMPVDADPFDKVCSNHNETFETLCHLYQEKCFCKHGDDRCKANKHNRAHLEYMGPCKELDECTEDHMKQFPERMADWLFQVMKEMKKRQELHGEKWLSLLDEAESDDEYKHVYPVLWKYCDLDRKPHDKYVTHQELIPITAPVIPMESCIKPFLSSCDTDDNDKITLKEWGKCLGLKEGEIAEKC